MYGSHFTFIMLSYVKGKKQGECGESSHSSKKGGGSEDRGASTAERKRAGAWGLRRLSETSCSNSRRCPFGLYKIFLENFKFKMLAYDIYIYIISYTYISYAKVKNHN